MATSDTCDSTIVDLGTLTTIVTSLQRVVADFYGPQCTQTLLTSKTGKAVVTSDGLCILDALQPAHPVAEVVFKALKNCHSVTLDGSKTFLLYLSNFLLQLQEEISMGRLSHGGINLSGGKSTLERHGVLCARRCVRKLKQTVLPKICAKLKQHSEGVVETMLLKVNEADLMKCVLRTALNPHYNPYMCEHIASLLISSLPNLNSQHSSSNSQSTVLQALQFLVDNFNSLTVKVSNQPYGGSTTQDLFLLNRKFTLKCDNLLTLSDMNALIIKATLDGSDTDVEQQQTFSVQQGGQIVDLLQQRRKMVEIFADKVKSRNIDLIISTEGVPGFALEIFRRSNISVIAHVVREDVELLEQLTQKMYVNNITDEIGDNNIVELSGVQEVVVGGKECVKLKLTNKIFPIKHLIICAPTVGLCDQLTVALHKSLNGLKMCYSPGDFMRTEIVDEDVRTVPSNNKRKYFKDGKSEKNDMDNVENGKTNSESNNPEVKTPLADGEMKGGNFEKKQHIEKEDKSGSKPGQAEDVLIDNDENLNIVNHSLATTIGRLSDYSKTHEHCRIIEGGGCFELLLARHLQGVSSFEDPNLSFICKVLEKTMISVVKKLFENTTVLPENKRKFIEVRTELEGKLANGQVWGLNRRGVPCDLVKKGVIEPLQSKIHILHCVLDLVEQLLGIDKILSVRKHEN